MKRISKLFILVFTVLMFSMPLPSNAQCGDNGIGTPEDAGCPDQSDLPMPFDGGVVVLVAFGIGYGIWRMRKNINTVKSLKECI